MKQTENETKKSETAVIFASKRNEARRKQNYFRFDAEKVYVNEMKRKKQKISEKLQSEKG
jgi:hypothetical protein